MREAGDSADSKCKRGHERLQWRAIITASFLPQSGEREGVPDLQGLRYSFVLSGQVGQEHQRNVMV